MLQDAFKLQYILGLEPRVYGSTWPLVEAAIGRRDDVERPCISQRVPRIVQNVCCCVKQLAPQRRARFCLHVDLLKHGECAPMNYAHVQIHRLERAKRVLPVGQGLVAPHALRDLHLRCRQRGATDVQAVERDFRRDTRVVAGSGERAVADREHHQESQRP